MRRTTSIRCGRSGRIRHQPRVSVRHRSSRRVLAIHCGVRAADHRGDRLPAELRATSSSGTETNLVRRIIVEDDGKMLRARKGVGGEFLASTDERFRPSVQRADGALHRRHAAWVSSAPIPASTARPHHQSQARAVDGTGTDLHHACDDDARYMVDGDRAGWRSWSALSHPNGWWRHGAAHARGARRS